MQKVTPAEARHVLHHYGDSDGVRPGSFVETLIKAIALADPINARKLGREYPGLVEAVRLASRQTGGVDLLKVVANRVEA